MREERVPPEFKSKESVRPVDMMWLELFGNFVYKAFEVFKEDLEKKERPTAFDLGFYVTNDADYAKPLLPPKLRKVVTRRFWESESEDEEKEKEKVAKGRQRPASSTNGAVVAVAEATVGAGAGAE